MRAAQVRRLWRPHPLVRDVVERDLIRRAEEHRAFDRVSKLADVAGPRVTLEQREHLGGEAWRRTSELSRELCDERAREWLDLVTPLSQRWHRQNDPVQIPQLAMRPMTTSPERGSGDVALSPSPDVTTSSIRSPALSSAGTREVCVA